MPKILVLCADSSAEWSDVLYRKAMTYMPPGFPEENARFRRAQDRRNRALARLLVLRGLAMIGALPFDGLSSWSVDSLGRPYLSQCNQSLESPEEGDASQRLADFNISHTDGSVVVALSRSSRVGVDVERCSGGGVEEYLSAFTENERAWIHAGEPAKERMLCLWTRKEAILKAAGTGFSLVTSAIDVLDGEAIIGGVLYRARELSIGLGGDSFPRKSVRDAICHLALEGADECSLPGDDSDEIEIRGLAPEEAVERGCARELFLRRHRFPNTL